ncbi:MAG: GTP-binding protein [Bacteroidales bacterium]|jgi:sulfate adenylyltransferase subunit 1|nr:GTP-binding protein [Bacteroidales bacterium]
MSTENNPAPGYLDMKLLRFTTAGSVDDGKSTLIGRLLYDSKAIFEDQMEALETASVNRGEEQVNLALLTDGLRAEREQGITIDVAYRYFATPKRKFIIADTPGHVQYTRNMVTGASTANLALILIDARQGVLEQTKRHAYIAALLGIPHVAICINKMDLVDYKEEVYDQILNDFESIQELLHIKDVRFIPISALKGDNVVDKSEEMAWYTGPTLLELLETIDITSDSDFVNKRFPVQYVIRPMRDEFHDYRGYAGRIAGGVFKPGDKLAVLPGGQTTTLKSIDVMNGVVDHAFPPQSVALSLEHDIDISRGYMIVDADNLPKSAQELDVMVCWLGESPMNLGGKYTIRHTTAELRCVIRDVKFKVNINTLEELSDDKSVGLNEIARISIKTTKPIFYDSYKDNRITGSISIIDEATNNTVGAGMIV